MLKNYIKIAFRNLIKNKSHTLINIGGLTLGIVCAIVIFLIIQFDLSFDKNHKDRDQIFRIVRHDTEFGKNEYNRGGPYPLAEAVRNDVSGLEYTVLVNDNFGNDPIISYFEDGQLKNRVKEEELTFADPDYFNILTYEWLAGNPDDALQRPNTAVITESFAKKLFRSTDVIGKFVVMSSGTVSDIEITGLVKDHPKNSSFPFVFIGSNKTKDRNGQINENSNWGSNSSGYQVFVKLKEGVKPDEVNAQFDNIITKYRSETRAEVMDFFLQPISEMHFDSRFEAYSGRVIEKKILFAFGIIGLFLLITACINFINLNTAIAVSRSKEVGLRKTLGGTRTQLIFHFLGETAFIVAISIIISLGLTEILLKVIEPVIGIAPELHLLTNTSAQLFLIILFFGITLLAGWYPAQQLSGFSPIEAIRNKIDSNYGKGVTLRRSLIVVQFSITQILIICTIVISTQIQFFQEKDLGFTKEALVEVSIPNRNKQVLSTFKNMLESQPSIQGVSFSNTGTTSNSVWGGNYIMEVDTTRYENDGQIKLVDEDFLETYGLILLAGTNLSPSDTVNAYLVNETFAKQVGYADKFEDLIGQRIFFWGDEAPIIGVVQDFNTVSLHAGLEPVVLATSPNFFIGGIKINTSQTQEALAQIERAYNQAFPESIFEYSFLDDNIAEMYEDEKNTAKIMNSFTIIAVLIGSLGLFGLVSYMATTRMKEIGVRKVLGASVFDILKIFGFELMVLTGISFLIAAPISWYLMRKWLADFAYKIDIGIEIFALSFLGILIISLLTVGYKSLRAALSNPIESLKSE